ncbi:MAG: YitT family protein [Firmicutes bacterium]|nr:YitT family protein [Bacillota bacterium]
MKSVSKEDFQSYARTLGLLALGSAIYSVGMNLFYTKAHLLSGGVAGFAQLLNYEFGFSISLMIILINIPMFLIGWFFVSHRFVITSLIGMAVFSGFIELFSPLSIPFESPLTAMVLGGLLTGLGLGLIYRSGASVGGTDIIAKLLHKYLSLNMASTGLAINVAIVLLAAFIRGIDQAVLTICAMFIASRVTTFVIDGIDHRRAILIVTNRKDELSHALMDALGRGITILDSHGAYTGHANSMLYCVIHKHQLQQLKMIVKRVDPDAFFSIITVNGVYGKGHSFVPMKNIDI